MAQHSFTDLYYMESYLTQQLMETPQQQLKIRDNITKQLIKVRELMQQLIEVKLNDEA